MLKFFLMTIFPKNLLNTFGLFFVFGSFFVSQTLQAAGPTVAEIQEFKNLLEEYKRFPKDFFKKMDRLTPEEIATIDREKVNLLEGQVLAARTKQYLPSYRKFLSMEKKLTDDQKELSKRLTETPLSNFKSRGDLELKQVALKNQIQQAQFAVFMTSINANLSIKEAGLTVSNNRIAQAEVADREKKRPKLPGVWGGDVWTRRQESDSEKSNLTPVDPEFYETQLGQKLESDLGGRAEFWSYDYDKDTLFVKQGNEIGKVTVFQDAGGIRFIRTRLGTGFDQVKSSDVRIDMGRAEGKFLTGDKNQESLFGRMPAKGPRVAEEVPAPAGKKKDGHEGHDH